MTPEQRVELIDELAYRTATSGKHAVSGFAEAKGLTRQEYVDLVSDETFEPLLARYTRAYVELPFHNELHERRMNFGATGGMSALESALKPPAQRIMISEETTTKRTIEGPMNELFSAFRESLSTSKSALHRPAVEDGGEADSAISGEVLPAGGDGGDGEGEGAEGPS